jgi:hypothetical protein
MSKVESPEEETLGWLLTVEGAGTATVMFAAAIPDKSTAVAALSAHVSFEGRLTPLSANDIVFLGLKPGEVRQV